MIATLLSSPVVFGTSLSEILQDAGLGAIVWTAFKHFNCHVNHPRFCWRFGHSVPNTSYRACHRHHHERHSKKVTEQDITEAATKGRGKSGKSSP